MNDHVLAMLLATLALLVGCPAEDDDTVDYCANYDPSDPLPSDWVFIEGGTFEMGSEDGDEDEQPVHTVTVPSFEMWRTEVTVEQYAHCFCDGRCAAPTPSDLVTADNWGTIGREGHPVNNVTWDDAEDYCTWLGGRLPTEAEWEYAAGSGGQSTMYPWGNEEPTCDYCVMFYGGVGCGEETTWEVCSKPLGNTEHGICDLAGNLGEWIQDPYHEDYTDAPSDGSAWTDGGYSNVVRGGSFLSGASRLTVSTRSPSSTPDLAFGFRCVF